MWRDLLHRVRAVLQRNKVETEIDRESQFFNGQPRLHVFFFQIRPNDPLTFGTATALLLLIALAAAYVPGRIAAHTSPVETLRAD